MALENLEPVTRMESILNGDNIEPVTREEYFWQQAATSGSGGLPEYTDADVGKVLTVGEGRPIWIGEYLDVVVTEDPETFICTIHATYNTIATALNNGAKVRLLEGEFVMGYVTRVSILNSPVLWVEWDDGAGNLATATAESATSEFLYSRDEPYGVFEVNITLNGSTWSSDKTHSELSGYPIGTPVTVWADIPGFDSKLSHMNIIPVFSPTTSGSSLVYSDRTKPVTVADNIRYNIQINIMADNTVTVQATKYEASVTDTDMLA